MQLSKLFPGPKTHSATEQSDKILLWWMIILIIARLWLLEAQDFLATYTPHDDYLFVNLAKHILSGDWLGPYNQVTLIKGPVYPLFIAAAHHTGLPLLTVQHLVYSLICILTIYAIRPIICNRWLLMTIFFLLLFNPFSYFYPASGRAFRLGLSMPLVLGLFASMCGLLLRADSTWVKKLLWAVATGLFFSLLWYTREEGIWLLPSVALCGLYFLLIGRTLSLATISYRSLYLFIIVVIFLGFTQTFSSLNLKHYGASQINELKSPEFKAALGGLMNIDEGKWVRFLPVNKESQLAAYRVSPTFKQLEPTFTELKQRHGWHKSFYIWVLRDVVYKSGNSNSLPETLAFYKKIGEEIQTACDNNEINCIDRKPTIRPVWRNDYFSLIPQTFLEISTQAITFSRFNAGDYDWAKCLTSANKEMVKDYRFVTREKLVPGHRKVINGYPEFYADMIVEKFRILNDIGKGYNFIIAYLFALAFFGHLFFLIKGIRHRCFSFELVSGLIVIGGLFSLCAVLTFVKITLWPVTRPLFSAYPLVLLYISLMFGFVFNQIKEVVTGQKV